MWNVFGYCNDFINDKVDFNEFKKIYENQRPLKSFILDSYNEVISSKFKDEFISNKGIIFPYLNYKNLNELILNSDDLNFIKLQIKLLIDFEVKINTH